MEDAKVQALNDDPVVKVMLLKWSLWL
jgi:hypothetical protein